MATSLWAPWTELYDLNMEYTTWALVSLTPGGSVFKVVEALGHMTFLVVLGH